MFLISPYAFSTSGGLLIDQITGLGLTSGLQLCLDAADALSYSTGQTWADRSGNAYDFLRGSTSSSQSTDPTFNGVAGGASSSEYWSFDGGDYFTLGQSNPTWVSNITKDSAVVTFASWCYLADDDATFCGTYSAVSGPAFNWYPTASSNMGVFVSNGTGTVYQVTGSDTIPLNAWAFVAVALNEAANAITLQINGAQQTGSCTYSGPGVASSSSRIQIGADGSNTFPLKNGSRMAEFMAWNTKLSDSDLLALYNATKSRFGL